MLASGHFAPGPGGAVAGPGGAVACWAFTDRLGGVSAPPWDSLNLADHVGDDPAAVAANRRAVAAELAARGVHRTVWLRAQHGAGVQWVDATRHGGLVAAAGDPAGTGVGAATGPVAGVGEVDPSVDALVTTDTGVGLVALSADCALIVLADTSAGVVAVAHCGRPGLVAGVVPAVVAAMRGAGAANLAAVVGPTICAACYEVPEELRSSVSAVAASAAAVSRAGTPAVDVAAGVTEQLVAAGVADVGRVGGCTAEEASLYSYRRDQVTGRMAAVVWLAAAS